MKRWHPEEKKMLDLGLFGLRVLHANAVTVVQGF